MTTNPLTIGRKMKPTQKHRPAIWECMLGTVYAMSDDGEVRYFDYKWTDAAEFAGVVDERDPRYFRAARSFSTNGRGGTDVRKGQLVLWITRQPKQRTHTS